MIPFISQGNVITVTIAPIGTRLSATDKDKRTTLLDFDKVLGLDLDKPQDLDVEDDFEKKVGELIESRSLAKAEKNYIRADEIRAELAKMGVELEDTKDGVKWHMR